MKGCLPVDCEYDENELKNRIEQGILAATPGEYLARSRLVDDVLNLTQKTLVVEDNLSFLLNKRKRVQVQPIISIQPECVSLIDSKIIEEFKKIKEYVRQCIDTSVDSSGTIPVIPKRSEKELWMLLMFGTFDKTDEELEQIQLKRKKKVRLLPYGCDPKVSYLVYIDYETVCVLFSRLCFSVDSLDEEKKVSWLYAFATVIETPLDANTEAAMTTFLRSSLVSKEAQVLKLIIKNYFHVM